MKADRAAMGPEGTAKPMSRVFYSRRVGPWLLVSLDATAAPAKPIRTSPHD